MSPIRKFLSLIFTWSISLSAAVEEREVDLLIVGATESGWAAAVQAVRSGVEKTVIVHDGEWFGGQFTEQALACVDENKGVGKVGWGVAWHPMKRSFHRSGLFDELMKQIEWFNDETYGDPMPGRPFHGPSTFRPAEAEAIFRKIIQPYLDSGRIEVFWNRYPTGASVDQSGERPRLTGLDFSPVDGGDANLRVLAKITIDASDWGEAIQVAGAAYECGPDPYSRYGEPSAPHDLSEFPPNEMNPITWAMIVEESVDETPIPQPANFDDRNYPRATHFSREEFKDLEWDRPAGKGAIQHWPDEGKESPRQLSVYTVRRVVDGNLKPDGKTSILLNYMNGQDYPLVRLPTRVVEALEQTEEGASRKNIVEMTRGQREIVFQDAKNHSLGVLYHLQNFVHKRAPDKANSFRRFHLSKEFGTSDNLPPKPYIRESLRLKSLYMMREQDGRNRDGETKLSAVERFSDVIYPDGLFAWQFHYDFHRTGRTYLKSEGEDGPWIDYEKPGRHTRFLSDRCVFPARSFIPVEMDGLLGAQKNLGYSSMVSAAIRLHDQCIHVGQASASLAAVSLKNEVDPRAIPFRRELLEETRHLLCGGHWGRPILIWPWRDLSANGNGFVAINRLSALGCLPLESEEVDFLPDEAATGEWKIEVRRLSETQFPGAAELPFPSDAEITRSEFCKRWWESIQAAGLEMTPFPVKGEGDTDGDGIADLDDALYLTPNDPILWGVKSPVLTPETDGLWDGEKTSMERRFNFSGSFSKGVEWDSGKPWHEGRKFGWKRDLSANHRKRSYYPETYRDTFLFTREEDTWQVAVQPGVQYEVTVCIGDSGHEQKGQNVRVEGEWIFQDVDTTAGAFVERKVVVTPDGDRLSVTIGKKGSNTNTCLCWLTLRRM
ncbi:MAG: FAD-dependent oxidoreductase [Verrucomicrobiales bacterium]|nr:FAD-dependent oxidoreductase [Verrucomicrobiales bacterium]